MTAIKTKLVTLIGVFLLAGCAEKPPEPMRIAVSPWPGYEPLYFAREKGHFSAKDVKLIDYPSTTAQSRAFQNGAVDATTLTLDTAFKLRASGVELKVVLIIDVSNGGDVLLAKPEFKSLKDLKYKRVGVETTSIGDYMLTRALDMAGMTLSDIQVVPLEVVEHERAFKEGRIEAVVTYEPTRTKLLALGAQKLFDSSQIPGEIMDVLAVREEYLQKGEQHLLTVLRGWFRALDDMRKDNGEAIRFMAQRERVTEQEFLASLKGLRIPDLKENQALLAGTPPGLLAPAQRLEKVLREKRLIDKELAVAKLIEGRYIGRVTK